MELTPTKMNELTHLESITLIEASDVAELSAVQKRSLYELVKKVMKASERIEEQLKVELSLEPDSIPGLRLEPGAIRQNITSSKAAYAALKELLPAEVFASCCTVVKSKLEDAILEYSPGLTRKQAEAMLYTTLEKAGCLEWKQSAPSLRLAPLPKEVQ